MKRRRGYFKHYNDATSGSTIQGLLAKKRPYAVILHWFFLERCNQQNSGEITVSISELSWRMFRRKDALLRDIFLISEDNQNFSFALDEDKLKISVLNYAEYQENRGQKSYKKVAKTVHIKDKRLKIKDKRLKIKENEFKNDLEKIYLSYPLKRGKSKGMKKALSVINSPDKLLNLEKAINNYAAECHKRNTESQYIKHFSTFMNEWEDWINLEQEREDQWL